MLFTRPTGHRSLILNEGRAPLESFVSLVGSSCCLSSWCKRKRKQSFHIEGECWRGESKTTNFRFGESEEIPTEVHDLVPAEMYVAVWVQLGKLTATFPFPGRDKHQHQVCSLIIAGHHIAPNVLEADNEIELLQNHDQQRSTNSTHQAVPQNGITSTTYVGLEEADQTGLQEHPDYVVHV